MKIISDARGLLVNDLTVGSALVLVGAVHFVGGGLSDMMERTLFGYSWLTVAVLSKKLLGTEVDPLGIADEV